MVCFGAEQAPYRVELYAGYHAQRPPMPDDAAPGSSRRRRRCSEGSAGSVDDSAELEADDLLGSYAQVEAAAGGETLILTGDRDMYQCVTTHTSVLYLKQGSPALRPSMPPRCERRYGIAPALVPDFIALRGDPSDGLPGAPGIGEKTAAELLRRHGSLESC